MNDYERIIAEKDKIISDKDKKIAELEEKINKVLQKLIDDGKINEFTINHTTGADDSAESKAE